MITSVALVINIERFHLNESSLYGNYVDENMR